jgi:hypothetical protein
MLDVTQWARASTHSMLILLSPHVSALSERRDRRPAAPKWQLWRNLVSALVNYFTWLSVSVT